MEDQTKTSTTRKTIKAANDAVVFGALAFSAYTLARLAYDGAKAGVDTLKNRKNNSEN